MKRSVVAKILLAVLWLAMPCVTHAQRADTQLQTPDTTYGIISSGKVLVTPTGGSQQPLADALAAATACTNNCVFTGTTIEQALSVSGAAVANSFTSISAMNVGGNLGVTGATSFTGGVTFNGANTVANGHSFNFADASGNNSGFIASGNSLLFRGTTAAGAASTAFTLPLHTDTPTLAFSIPVNATLSPVWSGSTATPVVRSAATVSGTTTSVVPYVNRFSIIDTVDGSALAQTPVTGFEIDHVYGGSTTKGGRTAFTASLVQASGANADTGVSNFYVGGVISAFGRYTQPGSSPTNPLGNIFGLNVYSQLQAGFTATNYLGVSGIEIDMSLGTSTSAGRSGLNINDSSSQSQGFVNDNAIWIYGLGSPWRYGLVFGDTQPWPIDNTTGTMIGANIGQGVNTRAFQAKWGVDIQQVTFPATANAYDGGAFRTNGMSINGAGTIQQGSCYTTWSSTGQSIDCKGSVGTSVAVATGGTGYPPGQVMAVTAYGGVWLVTASAGGVVTALTTVVQPTYPTTSPPSNPVTPTSQNLAAAGLAGTGLTINITWNTTASALSLNPSGGATTFGGVAKLRGFTVATLPAAATAGVGAMAYVTDATVPTYNGTLTGGGAVIVPVFSNGTAWTAH